MKDILQILLLIAFVAAISLGIIFGIDFLTGLVNKSICKSSFNNPSFHYRISDTSDLNIKVLTSTETFFVQRFANDSADVCVIAKTLNQDSPIPDVTKRLTYTYAEELDTLYYPFLKDLVLTYEKKPIFGNKIIREYSFPGDKSSKVKTVTIYAREYIYTFIQQYEVSSDLLNRLVDNFKSSRTFCIQNLLAVWADRLCRKDNGFIYSIFIWAWFIVCLSLCIVLYNYILEHIEYGFRGLTCMALVVILFIYLVLHDSLSDWIMSFGSFGEIPLQLYSMFFDD